MHKMKKIIISFVFSLVLMSVFSLCVFASYTETEYSSSSDFRGYTYVFNKCPTYCHTFYAEQQGIVSCGFSDFAYLEVKSVSRNSDGLITQMYFEPADSYTSLYTMDYSFKHILKEYSAGSRDINFQQTIYSVYGQITYIGYNIDWKYVTIPGSLVESGEQFSYYDYFGEIKTVTFTGDGGIFGGGSAGRYDDEIPEGEFPNLEDYLPNSSDDKYQSTSLSEYLPAPPDSIDILDWIKYFINCFKSVFNWLFDNLSKKFLYLYDVLKGFFSFVSDFFKSFFDNLRNIFISFFDFKDLMENNYLSTKFTELRDYVFIKFPFFNTFVNFYSDINGLISATTREAPTITYVLPEILGGRTEVVSLDFLDPVIAVTDVIVIAACYLLTIIYSIRAIPNIIGGIGSAHSGLDRSFNHQEQPDYLHDIFHIDKK